MAVTEGPAAMAAAGVAVELAGFGGMILFRPASLSVLVVGGVLLFVAGIAMAVESRWPSRR